MVSIGKCKYDNSSMYFLKVNETYMTITLKYQQDVHRNIVISRAMYSNTIPHGIHIEQHNTPEGPTNQASRIILVEFSKFQKVQPTRPFSRGNLMEF